MAARELNILDYWRILRRHKQLIVAVAVVVTVGTYGLASIFNPAPEYESSTRVKYDQSTNFEGLLVQAVSL